MMRVDGNGAGGRADGNCCGDGAGEEDEDGDDDEDEEQYLVLIVVELQLPQSVLGVFFWVLELQVWSSSNPTKAFWPLWKARWNTSGGDGSRTRRIPGTVEMKLPTWQWGRLERRSHSARFTDKKPGYVGYIKCVSTLKAQLALASYKTFKIFYPE